MNGLSQSPDSIFHYTRLNIAIEKILVSNQLLFSTLASTNDPYEYKKIFFAYSERLGPNENEISGFPHAIKHNMVLNSLIKDKSKIICFTMNTHDLFGYERSRMWAQYSENHRGVCLQFSKKKIADILEKEFTDLIYFYEPVEYCKIKYSDLDYRLLDERINNNYSDHIKKYRRDIYFKKNQDYRDEAETRIVVIDEKDKIKYLPIKDLLTGVILGDACPEPYWPLFRDICNKNGISLMQYFYANGEGILSGIQLPIGKNIIMALTSIEWTEASWNPVTGCTKISAGCQNCYAERMARRLRAMGQKNYRNGFQLTVHEEMFTLPKKWKRPKMIFVNSMSDLFHEELPFAVIENIFKIMNECHWHTFQVLTKRSKILLEYGKYLRWTPNIWMGVTVENAEQINRLDDLRKSAALNKFVSFEPLLTGIREPNLEGIDWVIVGGESGYGCRPIEKEWVVEIRDKCANEQIPFFFKQWGGTMKKKNGCLLDNKEWKQVPEKCN